MYKGKSRIGEKYKNEKTTDKKFRLLPFSPKACKSQGK